MFKTGNSQTLLLDIKISAVFIENMRRTQKFKPELMDAENSLLVTSSRNKMYWHVKCCVYYHTIKNI